MFFERSEQRFPPKCLLMLNLEKERAGVSVMGTEEESVFDSIQVLVR